MKIYAPIYLVRHHKGAYDEYRVTNICAFKTKAMADHFKHRIECVFDRILDFYRDKVYEIQEEHGYDVMGYSDETFEKWDIFMNRKNRFYGVEFDIEEIQVRRFHRSAKS